MPAGHWGWQGTVPFSHGWRVGDIVFTGGQRHSIRVADCATQAISGRSLSANIVETPATLGISGGRWR